MLQLKAHTDFLEGVVFYQQINFALRCLF